MGNYDKLLSVYSDLRARKLEGVTLRKFVTSPCGNFIRTGIALDLSDGVSISELSALTARICLVNGLKGRAIVRLLGEDTVYVFVFKRGIVPAFASDTDYSRPSVEWKIYV